MDMTKDHIVKKILLSFLFTHQIIINVFPFVERVSHFKLVKGKSKIVTVTVKLL